MKKRIKDEEKSFFKVVFSPLKRLCRKIGDSFYSLSVAIHAKTAKPTPKNVTPSARRIKESIFYYCMIAFPLLQFLVFYVGVNANSILLSFKSYEITDNGVGYIWVGLKNYSDFIKSFATDPDMLRMAANSLILYGSGLLVGVPLAILFSFYLYKNFALSSVFKVLLFLPSIISSVVMVLMYKYFVDFGFPALMKKFGVHVIAPLGVSTTAFKWIIFYNLFISFGSNVIMYTSGMTRIPPSLTEYARLEGCGYWQELIYIVIPLIFPTITTFLVVGVAGIFTNQANLYTFYGTGASSEVITFGYYLFGKIAGNVHSNADYPYVSAAGIVFTFIAVPLTFLVKWALEKFGPVSEF